MNDTKLTVEYMNITALKPYERNARKHEPKDIAAIRKSIEDFGFNDPIGIWHDTIVEGHGRLLAAKDLGMTEVPVIRLDHLDDEGRRAYAIAHNKTAENSEWDMPVLESELRDLEKYFDMTDFGFDAPADDAEPAEVVEDEVPEEAPTRAKLGDIWQLGEHRLMCGDSTDAECVAKLMDGAKADITFTSPPYNAGSLNIKGQKGTQKKYNEYDDNKTEQEYLLFLQSNMELMLNCSNEVFYNIGLVENNKRDIFRLVTAFLPKFKDIIYWEKDTVAPHIQEGVINNLVEFILCFGDGKRKFQNAQFGQGTYWNVIKGSSARGNEYSDIHKATFPLYLPANIVENFTRKNGTVVDCFGGTGTTLIACEQLNCKCYMMELDPHYVDVIIARWEQLTGQKAVLLNG